MDSLFGWQSVPTVRRIAAGTAVTGQFRQSVFDFEIDFEPQQFAQEPFGEVVEFFGVESSIATMEVE